MNWAYEQDVPLNEKFLLVTLADFADEKHSCYPGQEMLAKRISASVSTVRRLLKSLAEKQLIEIETRYPDGAAGRKTNRYRLAVNLTGRPVSDGGSTGQTEGGLPVNCDTYKEPSEEPSGSSPYKSPTDFTELQAEEFEQAWQHWPNKNSKAKALAKFLLLTKHGLPVRRLARWITEYGDAYAATVAAGTSPKFVPHLVTWLNGERWSDPLPQSYTPRGDGGILPQSAEEILEMDRRAGYR